MCFLTDPPTPLFKKGVKILGKISPNTENPKRLEIFEKENLLREKLKDKISWVRR